MDIGSILNDFGIKYRSKIGDLGYQFTGEYNSEKRSIIVTVCSDEVIPKNMKKHIEDKVLPKFFPQTGDRLPVKVEYGNPVEFL